MIFAGLELIGEIPFRDVIIHSTVLAPDGRRMSKSLGTGVDPMEIIDEYGADATRYGLLKMSSSRTSRFSYKAIEEGRRLANKLWNVSRLILQNAEGVEPAPSARPRGALDPRAHRRRARGGRGGAGARSTSPRRPCPLPPHLRRLLRLVRGGDQAAALRPDDEARRDRARRARAAPRAPPSGDAARDRGDLVAAARPRGAADRVAVAGGGRDVRRRAGALDRVQEAAQIFRRSGVQVELGRTTSAGSSPRRPARSRPGRRQPRRRDRAAAQGGRARARACSRTSASSRTRPTTWWRRSARSSSATAASSPRSAAARSEPFTGAAASWASPTAPAGERDADGSRRLA